jgi:hypothetical protein
MDRADAEAVYDAGRDLCVQFILDLAARVERHEERLRRLGTGSAGLTDEFSPAVL